MAKTNNLTDFLTDIADGIRAKKGTSEKINPQDFRTEIESIETGINTSDANAVATDILSGKTAYVNGKKVIGSMESIEANTYTPTTINQTIEANKYLAGAQTIKGDVNLVSSNIKAGTTIFGINGDTNVIDTSLGNGDFAATASNIRSNLTAFVNGKK